MLEMRKFVRFDTQQSASLKTSEGLELVVKLDNISIGGARLSEGLELVVKLDNISIGGARFTCDHLTAQGILPHNYQPDPAAPILLTIKIDLDGMNARFEATCGIKSYYRLAQDIYRFHVNFSILDHEKKQQLTSFIN